MNKRDKDTIFKLYENAVFIAKAADLQQGMDSSIEIEDNSPVKEPEMDSQEVHMAKSDLLQIATDVAKLNELLDKEPGLEGWVAAKITLAANYISSVTDWLVYKDSTKQDCDCI